MPTNFEDVRVFHACLGAPMPDKPVFPSEDRIQMRLDLNHEEDTELREAIAARDIVAVADAIADLLYVTYGLGVEFGLPIDKIFAEVHRSNMTKFKHGAHFREDGKLLKGPGFEPPKIKEILELK